MRRLRHIVSIDQMYFFFHFFIMDVCLRRNSSPHLLLYFKDEKQIKRVGERR